MNTMLKIEASDKMTAAITRCKKTRPRVRRIDAQTVSVQGSNGAYTVRLVSPRPDLHLASCDCKAGQAGLLCYHVPAALAAPAIPAAPAVALKPQTSTSEREAAILVKPQGKALLIDGWAV